MVDFPPDDLLAPRVPSLGLDNGRFTDGDPATDTPGSLDSALVDNMMLDELLEVVTKAGLTPDFSNTTQLYQAIQALMAVRAPTGMVIWHAAETPPAGFLVCDGALLSRATYAQLFGVIGTIFGAGDGSTTFALPDLRGEFVRGWDGGRGVDAGRIFGSFQGAAIGPHTHDTEGRYVYRYLDPGTGQYVSHPYSSGDPITSVIADTGTGISTETRPRNVALLPCIRY